MLHPILEWARRLEQVEKMKARERMSEGGQGKEIVPALQGQSRDIVAAEVGFGSGKTYEKAKFVADHAEPEVIARLEAEETAYAIFCGLGYQSGKPRFDAERNYPPSDRHNCAGCTGLKIRLSDPVGTCPQVGKIFYK